MFCTRCGTQISDESRFCTNCGQVRGASGTAQAPPRAVPPIEASHNSGKAIASLICGLFFFVFPAAIVAIVLGHISLFEIKESEGLIKGRGTAIAGLVLGYFGVAIVPVMLIIAAIVVPNLLRARQAADEASAIETLRTINEAAADYGTTYSNGYPESLEILAGNEAPNANCNNAKLISESAASGQSHGYIFGYALREKVGVKRVLTPEAIKNMCTEPGGTAYTLTADPIVRGTTGQRGFYTDESGVIRFDREGSASASSDALE